MSEYPQDNPHEWLNVGFIRKAEKRYIIIQTIITMIVVEFLGLLGLLYYLEGSSIIPPL